MNLRTLSSARRLRLLLLIASVAALCSILSIRGNFPEESGTSTISAEDLLFQIESQDVDLDRLESDGGTSKLFGNFGPGLECYLGGTDAEISRKSGQCHCLPDYHGQDCGVPAAVWAVPENRNRTFLRRVTPRRMVLAVALNHELDMLQIRLGSLAEEELSSDSAPNVLVIGESNLTAAGEPKQLFFRDSVRNGLFRDVLDPERTIYVQQHSFPEGAVSDGWQADHYIRSHLSRAALDRLVNLRDDDLFLNFDADEVPDARVLTFLKLYDCLGEPPVISILHRRNIYGYFWRAKEGDAIISGSTAGFLRDVCDGDVYLVRGLKMERNCTGWREYVRTLPDADKEEASGAPTLRIGTEDHPGGHHCTYCLDPEGIRLKLLSAQKADKPRWGDNPAKTKLKYIEANIRKGRGFDGRKSAKRVAAYSGPAGVAAPKYVMRRKERYEKLLLHPDDRGKN